MGGHGYWGNAATEQSEDKIGGFGRFIARILPYRNLLIQAIAIVPNLSRDNRKALVDNSGRGAIAAFISSLH
ncbi:hypothetical protein LC653_14210 [Nostoc sp. CHAB 5784]|uniref:hypothetical protein n=1 Tax=Nostoc mirabile TaxID=2907820 RepID=UPI001E5C57C1|nr:hypothetical protein [Nostoc mirabile]MCC5665039.1 hypothetical protein [Nostoc mirabile CHAB5784]